MNAIKPKLEQKDVGYGGMRAIGDAIGKQILELQDKVRQLQAENEALKKEAALQRLSDFTQEAENEPVAWIRQSKYGKPIIVQNPCYQFSYQAECAKWDDIPIYTHPAKTQLSNGHLSDCAIHNEPARKNKDCDCGFEPKFDLSGLKHEDNCRYFDDGMFCTCGADNHALVEWYRHKEVTHSAKTLTDKLEKLLCSILGEYYVGGEAEEALAEEIRAILRKANEK